MRSLVILLASVALGFSQGSVTFRNNVVFQSEDPTGGGRLVYELGSPLDPVKGFGLTGTNWVAELYVGTDVASLSPLTASISRFRDTTTAAKGRWSLVTIYGTLNSSTLLPFPAGTTLTLQVKVWDFSRFATYEEATGEQAVTGESAPFSYLIPQPTDPPSYWFMDGLRAFALSLPPGCVRTRAQAVVQLVDGVVVGTTITHAGCGYTNPPVVLIQGGGGSGATARAIVANGQVIAIEITSPGCCYTSIPSIAIASPWFRPTVSSSATRVKVEQHVVLARKYVLEASFDTINWTPTAPSFIAESETIENEFDVGAVGSFFRVREVP